MRQDVYTQYIGSCCGNSFVILDCRDNRLSRKDKIKFAKKNIPKYKVDSALFLGKSKKADVHMEIFEKDGSQSESCGNGMLLISNFLGLHKGSIETKAGIMGIRGDVKRQAILMNIKLSNAKKKKVDDKKDCFFVKSGEPHMICFVDNVGKVNLDKLGKDIQEKYPKGINMDVLQKKDGTHYLIRTYERGVLAETESCGTGSLSAFGAISQFDGKIHKEPIEFKSVGGRHWVSVNKNMLRLETLKKFCKIKPL
ncbi:MAG: diaminopimelate epimerase [Minisyncoccia bacterium]